MGIALYEAPVKGIGRKDYSKMVERSVTAFATVALAQEWLTIYSKYCSIPVPAFPDVYEVIIPMPQEDGTWDWLASTIPTSWYDFSVHTDLNNLAYVGFQNYANLTDYFADIIHEQLGEVFGYRQAKLISSKGIPTEAGYLYTIRYAVWSTKPWAGGVYQDVTIHSHGMVTEKAQLLH